MPLVEDFQVQRVYDAERETSAFYARPLDTPQEAHRFVNHLRTTEAWNTRYSHTNKKVLGIIFTDSHSLYDAAYHYPTLSQWNAGWWGHIDCTSTGRTVGVLLHELAHFVTAEAYLNCKCEAHGWQFVRCYLHLVWVVLGKASAKELAHAFVEYGVKGIQ